MTRFWRALVVVGALFIALVAFSARAFAFTPPSLTGYIVDTAGKLSAADKRYLDDKLMRIKQSGGPQIAVLVTRSLEGETIEDVSIATARAWKIGSKADNGALIVIAPSDRKVRIEVGKHLEGDLTDLESSDIIRHKIGPRLRANDFRGAIEDGADAIATAVTHGSPIDAERHAKRAAPPERRGSPLLGLLVFGAPIALIILVVILNRRRGRDGGGDGGGGFWWGGGGGGWGGGDGGDGGGDSGPSGGGDFGGGGSSDSY